MALRGGVTGKEISQNLNWVNINNRPVFAFLKNPLFPGSCKKFLFKHDPNAS
jgi:hypothetical protein